MHELAICQSLIGAVEKAAAGQGGGEVTAILVAIGPLSNVEPSLLERAFSLAREGTIASQAQLRNRSHAGPGLVRGLSIGKPGQREPSDLRRLRRLAGGIALGR